MPGKKSKKKARKAVKFKTVTIKLSSKQKRSLVNYSKVYRTTPNKLIKKAIRPLLENYADLEVGERPARQKVSQLELF